LLVHVGVGLPAVHLVCRVHRRWQHLDTAHFRQEFAHSVRRGALDVGLVELLLTNMTEVGVGVSVEHGEVLVSLLLRGVRLTSCGI